MSSSSFLLWPLSSNRLMVCSISLLVCSGDVQMRYARHSSPLNVALAVEGCWHDCGLIVIFVLFFGFFFLYLVPL